MLLSVILIMPSERAIHAKITEIFKLVGPGKDNNFSLKIDHLFTVNTNGNTVVGIWNVKVECD